MTEPSLLPPDDDLEALHTRNYETRTYILDDNTMLVRGAISDRKPPGMYITDDPDPLEIHQMQVELHVSLPDLTITKAKVGFETHPHETCPAIATKYEDMIGLNIARGFTRKVRELFGGPRGCAHTTALLQAMAPAVVQSIWSVNVRKARLSGEPPAGASESRRKLAMQSNINTCHVWDEDGPQVEAIRAGKIESGVPLPMRDRLVELGRSPQEWAYGQDND